MAGRKVEVLEGELGQLKTDFEEKISDFQNQFSSIHEKMDGRFAALEDLMKKMIDDKQKPASSETIGGHGRGDPNPSRGRENPEVGVLEGDDGMPPLEPLSREELSRGYDRQEAEYVGRREEFYRRGAGFERIQRRGADFERGRADFHSRGADFERIQRRGADFEGRREEIHRRGADFERNQRRGDDFEGRRGETSNQDSKGFHGKLDQDSTADVWNDLKRTHREMSFSHQGRIDASRGAGCLPTIFTVAFLCWALPCSGCVRWAAACWPSRALFAVSVGILPVGFPLPCFLCPLAAACWSLPRPIPVSVGLIPVGLPVPICCVRWAAACWPSRALFSVRWVPVPV
ncbi:hypothetical protein M5K25_025800 [Dendrobium thyrsiflorum]|uniref:Uncharacterized protein n=1 Tax=Dendrobium thyrsiflorum TaxID=117978 RepID=A0ABD0UAL9_DENTH